MKGTTDIRDAANKRAEEIHGGKNKRMTKDGPELSDGLDRSEASHVLSRFYDNLTHDHRQELISEFRKYPNAGLKRNQDTHKPALNSVKPTLGGLEDEDIDDLAEWPPFPASKTPVRHVEFPKNLK